MGWTLLYGICAKLTFLPLSPILYAINLWAHVCIKVVGSLWPTLFLVDIHSLLTLK